MFITSLKHIILLILVLLLQLSTSVYALPQVFTQSMVLGNSDMYINKHFGSANEIQKYLQDKKSVLANLNFPISLNSDDDLLRLPTNNSKPDYLLPAKILPKYTRLSVAEIIWGLSQTELGNGCHTLYTDICINNYQRPIDPAFLITLIQKESGLIYGVNARKSASPDLDFILDRATGYFCFENPNKARSCYDENQNWTYFKGFFRQVYFASRFLRLWTERCERGGKYAFKNSSGVYQVDNTIMVDGKPVYLSNGITCAMYIYTPHVSAQLLVYNVYKSLPVKVVR
jgi:hypothetical protein